LEDAIRKSSHTAACYGNWNDLAPDCVRCCLRTWCEETIKEWEKRRKNIPGLDDESLAGYSTVSPLEYLLRTLAGKYDHQVSRDGDIIRHVFRESDGRAAVMVAMKGKSALIRTATKRIEVPELTSTRQVEEILRSLR